MPGTDWDPSTGAGTNYWKAFSSDMKGLARAGMQKLGFGGKSPDAGEQLMGETGRSRTYKDDSGGDVDVVK